MIVKPDEILTIVFSKIFRKYLSTVKKKLFCAIVILGVWISDFKKNNCYAIYNECFKLTSLSLKNVTKSTRT